MPKPVKKAAPTPAKKSKKPSADPQVRARQLMDEHMAKLAQGKFAEAGITVTDTFDKRPASAEESAKFEAQYRARMKALGSKGGKVSGAKRMEMPAAKRRAIAATAAAARWKKKRDEKGRA
jgi:hypothetical protein